MTPMMRTNNWIPTVFNDFFDTDFMPRANCTAPAINVKETDKAYVVELAAPGMKKEDFNVHINDEGNLIVKMEKKNENKEEDKSARYLRREFSYSKFEQTLLLPDDVKREDIKAHVENGVLTVELPKQVEEKVKLSRQIEIG
ncbi:Hsp20/alpha crystallin family protein [Prevotella communis]|jgi:HSP20 family protein|nr:Hsp20/alpha crystallin family protein [Prevotella communis]MCR5472515.1 Hsp20/alpha crystallin family protein [Prevotella sp.]UKK57502.1 Hsp20/alpha crystallin family protein [Prevotella communis]UKK60183.1 Hsp20/alpha crystallin family protein [Prevotella communis]UKK62918.1 Hsp20/alpha crystallin family protein [Prevotella communis]UKK65743.1 Hsp20/alpha crystallin family protein [Prevotella communis]